MRSPCQFGFGHITELYIRKTFNHEDGLLECFAATFLFNWGYRILAPCFGFLREWSSKFPIYYLSNFWFNKVYFGHIFDKLQSSCLTEQSTYWSIFLAWPVPYHLFFFLFLVLSFPQTCLIFHTNNFASRPISDLLLIKATIGYLSMAGFSYPLLWCHLNLLTTPLNCSLRKSILSKLPTLPCRCRNVSSSPFPT